MISKLPHFTIWYGHPSPGTGSILTLLALSVEVEERVMEKQADLKAQHDSHAKHHK